MSLNFPNNHLEGLLGLSEKYEKLFRPAAQLSESALAMSAARALKVANPYLEMRERLNARLPKATGLFALLDSTHHARSITGQLQSLSALTKPLGHQLAALRTPTSEWAALRQPLVDMTPIRALHQQQQAQLTAFSQQLAESISSARHFADLLRPGLEALTPGGLWSSRLMEWADRFDAASSEFDGQSALDGEDAGVDEQNGAGMAITLEPLGNRLETLEVVSAADVAALRAYLEDVYAAITTAIGLAVSKMLRTGHGAAASVLLYAGTLGGFLTLVGLPGMVDTYITRLDTLIHPEHAAATREDLRQLKADVLASIKQMAAEQGQLRTVDRRLRVRAKPSERAICLGTIQAGQQVVVLGLAGKRAYISYQDVDQLPMHGWVLKKYLNRRSGSQQ